MGYVTMLTPEEDALANWIASLRNGNSTRAGDVPAYGAPANTDADAALMANVIGARGEIAVARLLDLFPNLSVYHQEKRTGGYDLGHRVCVRSAQKRFGLLVRPADTPDGRYVATVVDGLEVRVTGWMEGGEAMQEKWLRAPGGRPPCYLVPEASLRPMRELMDLLGRR
jgi:hypothetical protein